LGRTTQHRLKAFIFNLEENLIEELSFTDTRRQGFFYNEGYIQEAADMDGDERVKFAFP